jgi:Stage II sporulation protein E (SpoIIE)
MDTNLKLPKIRKKKMINADDTFVEIECCQRTKTGQSVCGDDFKSIHLNEENRYISVLSDGLGSGIKASLLANMTTAMILRFVSQNMEIKSSAKIIMDTLPVCEVRKISYSTFTVVDILAHGLTRIVEMDNPPYIHLRNGKDIEWKRKELCSEEWPDRKLMLSEFRTIPGDRIIFFSDGVTQAGMGYSITKFGWRRSGCLEFVQKLVARDNNISARELSHSIVGQAATKNPGYCAIDDISCAVIYFRKPRKMRLLTGPPYNKSYDSSFSKSVLDFDGYKVLCGGTTAQIVARELKRDLKTVIRSRDGMPPIAEIRGLDLVTEGILTLTEVAHQLEIDDPAISPPYAVGEIMKMFQASDVIEFLVGTRINEAHQDPTLPVDLEIRRNIIKRLKSLLEEKYRKKVIINYY